jgi:membrane fusion protein (multidrug efflux system)
MTSPIPIPTPSAQRFRRPALMALLAVALLAALVWGGRAWHYARTHESTDNAQVDGHIIPVLAKVGGYVTAVSINENDPVTDGAFLVQLDSTEYAVRLAQAQADLAAARAAVGNHGTTGQAEAAIETATNQASASELQIEAARANEARAIADLTRFEGLAAKRIASQQQLEAARAAAASATATREALEQQSLAAGASVRSARAGLRAAQARMDAAETQVHAAELQLGYTRVTAPASGVIARRQVEIGQLVQPGQPLLSIVADTGVYVTANFKETQLTDLRVGDAVDLEVDAYPDCPARGTVSSISGATGARFALIPPDNATGNFTKVVQRIPVRIAITEGCGDGRPLRPGMSVTAHVETGRP